MTEAPNFIIRQGQVDDADRLRAIARGAYQQYVAEMGKEPAPMLTDYAKHLAQDTVVVAISKQKKIAGFAILISKSDGYWLENIAVDQSMTGQGLGGLLLHHVESWLLAQGHKTIRLYTNIVMRQNMAWYQRRGYREYERKTEEGYERVFFLKELSDVSA